MAIIPVGQLDKTEQNCTSAQNTGLSPKQHQAIASLVSTGSISETSVALRISRTSLYSWMGQQAFSEALGALQVKLLDAVQGRCATLIHLSLDKLADALNDADSRVRVKAADVLLSRMVPLLEHIHFAERLKKIEECLAKKDGLL